MTTENAPLPETGKPRFAAVKAALVRTLSTPVKVLVSLSKYCRRSLDQMERTEELAVNALTCPAVAVTATMPRCCSVLPFVIPTPRRIFKCEAVKPLPVLKATITVPTLAASLNWLTFAASVGLSVAAVAAEIERQTSKVAREAVLILLNIFKGLLLFAERFASLSTRTSKQINGRQGQV